MPVISVITITKGNPAGFARTKASVSAQTFADYEWIVVDGDAEPDDGIYDAMNKGLDRAQGDYMVFMNAGDAFAAPDTLDRVARACGGADFLYGDAIEAGHTKPARCHSGIAFGMITHHQAMYYRRTAVSGLRYDTAYAVAADYKFTAQALMRARSCIHLHFPVCIFESGGVSQRRAAAGRREQMRIKRELGLAPLPLAAAIAGMQAASQTLREKMPALWWALRSARGGPGARREIA